LSGKIKFEVYLFSFQEGIAVEFLDFSEYSDPPLFTSVTTNRGAEGGADQASNEMVRSSAKQFFIIFFFIKFPKVKDLSLIFTAPLQTCSDMPRKLLHLPYRTQIKLEEEKSALARF
jgi:hypothetical protein